MTTQNNALAHTSPWERSPVGPTHLGNLPQSGGNYLKPDTLTLLYPHTSHDGLHGFMDCTPILRRFGGQTAKLILGVRAKRGAKHDTNHAFYCKTARSATPENPAREFELPETRSTQTISHKASPVEGLYKTSGPASRNAD